MKNKGTATGVYAQTKPEPHWEATVANNDSDDIYCSAHAVLKDSCAISLMFHATLRTRVQL